MATFPGHRSIYSRYAALTVPMIPIITHINIQLTCDVNALLHRCPLSHK